MEIWKDIVGYEGIYQVSNTGKVKSLNYNRTGKEKVLKPLKLKRGYLQIALCKDGKVKKFNIHRLVAIMFLENPENKPCVNHLDCNPSNNCVDNLEWCTQRENIRYASKLGRIKSAENGKKTTCKSVVATNIKTGEMFYFESIREAARQLNLNQGNINSVLKGKLKQTGGYTFKYLKED